MSTRYTIPTDPAWWGEGMDYDAAHATAEVVKDLLWAYCERNYIFLVIELVPEAHSWGNRPSGDRQIIALLDRIGRPGSTERAFTAADLTFALHLVADDVSKLAAKEGLGDGKLFSLSEALRIRELARMQEQGLWLIEERHPHSRAAKAARGPNLDSLDVIGGGEQHAMVRSSRNEAEAAIGDEPLRIGRL